MDQWESIHLSMQETQIHFLGWEEPLEKEIATCSGILAWEIPWIEELGGLQSMGLQRVGHDVGTKEQQQQHDWSSWAVLSHSSRVRLFATPRTVALQAPLSMRILQASMHWSGLACPPAFGLPWFPSLQGRFFTVWATREVQEYWSG